jgi:predicted HicB family RNase H-like nuclease
MNPAQPVKKRGGQRAGAGRPKLERPKRKILLHIAPEIDDALSEAAKSAGTSKSEYAERAIKSRLKKQKVT